MPSSSTLVVLMAYSQHVPEPERRDICLGDLKFYVIDDQPVPNHRKEDGDFIGPHCDNRLKALDIKYLLFCLSATSLYPFYLFVYWRHVVIRVVVLLHILDSSS